MTEDDRPPFAASLILPIAALLFIAHEMVNALSPFGIHRDELLYAAMGRHLQLFRMDFPPMIAIMANVQRAAFGDSLPSLRALSAVAAGMLVIVAALVARELGGGKRAQGLAALFVVFNVLFLRAATLFQPVVFDQLWWSLALWTLARRLRTEDLRWWIAFGVVCGIGLLTKFSILFFGVGAFAAILLSPLRRDLLTPYPWLGAVLVFVIGAPSIAGQIALGWPVVKQMADLRQGQLEHVTFGSYVGEQLLYGVGTLVAWAGVAMLFTKRWARFRPIAIACVASWLLLLVLRGKPYYIGPIYPALIGVGAVFLDEQEGRTGVALRWATALAAIAYAAITLPIALPILPAPRTAAYARQLGITAAVRTNYGTVAVLPQDFADMLPWKQQVAALATVYRSLPDSDRERVVIGADNYGEAGAVDYYGPAYGLPNAICGCGSYWFWGPGDKPGDVMLTVGVDSTDIAQWYDEQHLAAVVAGIYFVDEEQHVQIRVARKPRTTMQRLWPSFAGQN